MTAVRQFRLLPTGEWHLGVQVRQTYRWDDRGALLVAASQKPVGQDESAAWKPSTDVILEGFAYAPGGWGTQVVAQLQVGSTMRQVRATGDRAIEACWGTNVEWSEPEAFDRMALDRTRAYGGFDKVAFELEGDAAAEVAADFGADLAAASRFSYPRNPRGVGFYLAAGGDRNRGRPVPNLDDPEDPVEPGRLIRGGWDDWIDAPTPASWGWTELTDFPRSALLGVPWQARAPSRRIRELDLGAISERDLRPKRAPESAVGCLPPGLFTEPRIALGAAPGWSGVRIVGGESIVMRNLEARVRETVLVVPRRPPSIRLRPPGCGWFQLEPQIDSLVLHPEERELGLVFSARLRVAGPYPNDELAQVERAIEWAELV